ncbi:hypothetical protein [Fulvitalea axinellae]|uniref:hypothetical protein n=1 Tax=Fulvitalea axinellae TaxID=1182444 RepID=UPI0030CA37AD
MEPTLHPGSDLATSVPLQAVTLPAFRALLLTALPPVPSACQHYVPLPFRSCRRYRAVTPYRPAAGPASARVRLACVVGRASATLTKSLRQVGRLVFVRSSAILRKRTNKAGHTLRKLRALRPPPSLRSQAARAADAAKGLRKSEARPHPRPPPQKGHRPERQ